MGLFQEINKAADKLLPSQQGFKGRSRTGRTNSTDLFFMGGTGPAASREQFQQRNQSIGLLLSGDAKGFGRGAEKEVSLFGNQIEGSVYGANLGHKLMTQPSESKPPKVGEGEATAEDREAAQRAARLRASEQAKARFGFDSTVATTPLGLSNDAAIGRKKLIGN